MFKKIFALGIFICLVQSTNTNAQNNIVRFNLLTAMDIGLGPGISYERIFPNNEKIGFILPMNLLLDEKGSEFNGGSQYYRYFYLSPGIKFYPFGQKRVTYAFGPNLMFGLGGGNGIVNDYSYPYPTYPGSYDIPIKKTVFRFGVLFNNYVNFQITKEINIGMTAGLGIRYYDKEVFVKSSNSDILYNISNPYSLTGQFTVSMGYRF